MRGFRIIILASLSSILTETPDCRADAPAREWTYRADPPTGMIRADLHFKVVSTNSTFAGVLVLSPGMNGNGGGLLSDSDWVRFARRNDLLMVGISFASECDDLENGRGYYYASKGSGAALLNGLAEANGDGIPLYMYGFSGGAHFTSRFVMWRPQAVRAWCAYSAAWWDEPSSGKGLPLGIVACGRKDIRMDASLRFFESGRALAANWLWVCPRDIGHQPSSDLEAFFRRYVEALSGQGAADNGVWINVHSGNEESMAFAERFPCAVGWLPAKSLLPAWTRIGGFR